MEQMSVVLLVSQRDLAQRLSDALGQLGWSTRIYADADDALEATFEGEGQALVAWDLTGALALRALLDGPTNAPVPLVAVVRPGDVTQAVRAMRAGAITAIEANADNLDAIVPTIDHALQRDLAVRLDPLHHSLDVTSEGIDMAETLEALERRMLIQALQKSNGNKARAARLLGLNRTTFIEKLKRRHLTGPVQPG